MNKPATHAPVPQVISGEGLRSIVDGRKLAPRVRLLLEGMIKRTALHFDVGVTRWLDELEQELFKRAERAPSNERQSADFEALREIKRARADFTANFTLLAQSEMAMTVGPQAAPPKAARKTTLGMDLELIDSGVLEEDLALQELVGKSEVRHSQSLYVLGHRIAVMFALPALDNATIPLGPARLSSIVQSAIGKLDLRRDYRVLAYDLFDRVVMRDYGRYLDSLNEYLATQRILPHLRFRGNQSRVADAADAVSGAGASPTTEPSSSAKDFTTAAATPSASSSAGRGGSADEFADVPAPELFATLRELLADKRHALGTDARRTAADYLPNGADLQFALGAMQAQSVTPAGKRSRRIPRSTEQIKQDLFAQLREGNAHGKTPVLADEDSDTVDLVGMLFDFIVSSLRPRGPGRMLLTRLQVPLLRVALSDKEFFARRNHPARRLLNTIAEAGEHWIDDVDADKDLIDKMRWAVDRVATEFDGDVSLFESTATDLDKHLELVAHRAQVAESRHVAAAQGREKLAAARERASTAVARLLARRPGTLSSLIKTMLEQAWTDVLALTILRHGEDSTPYHRRLGVADQLVRRDKSDEASADPTLQQEIESGLMQVGIHAEEARTIARRLLDPRAEVDDSEATPTAIALALKNKARLGGSDEAGTRSAMVSVKSSDLNEQELAMLAHLKTLPFGTWFEFVTNQQGDAVRRKLAWYSTMTGRCLFVNQRGARVDDKQLPQLARDLVRGEVRLVRPHEESLIDRTWKAIMNTLKQFKHGPAVPPPA
ncbi:MAG: DUF1631 domain-containing protein [Rhodanobacteraceae bacterium]